MILTLDVKTCIYNKFINGYFNELNISVIFQTNICRLVFCPTGQLRNKKGICIYPSKLWFNQYYAVYINLTAERPINETDMFKVPPGVRTVVLPPLD
jgi:hypothetical protein